MSCFGSQRNCAQRTVRLELHIPIVLVNHQDLDCHEEGM